MPHAPDSSTSAKPREASDIVALLELWRAEAGESHPSPPLPEINDTPLEPEDFL